MSDDRGLYGAAPVDRYGGVTPKAAAGRNRSYSNRDPGPRNGSPRNGGPRSGGAGSGGGGASAAPSSFFDPARYAAAMDLVVNDSNYVAKLDGVTELVFFGITGAPLTDAHLSLIVKLAEYYLKFFPTTKVMLSPSSNFHTKKSVVCVKGYDKDPAPKENFRVQLHLEVALLAHQELIRKYGSSNIVVYLDEQNQNTATYLVMEKLIKWVNSVTLYYGRDAVKDLVRRRWAYARKFCQAIFEKKIKVLMFDRDDITREQLHELANAPFQVLEIDGKKESVYGPEAQNNEKNETGRGPINEISSQLLIGNPASKINPIIENAPPEILTAADLEQLESVSSTTARVVLEIAWKQSSDNNDKFAKIILALPKDILPIPDSIIKMIANWHSYPGFPSPKPTQPPWTDLICADSSLLTPEERAAGTTKETESAKYKTEKANVDAFLAARPDLLVGGGRRNRNRKQRKTQRKSRRRARNARRSRKQ